MIQTISTTVRTERAALVTAMLAAILVGAACLLVAPRCYVDDAGFFFEYAANAAAGHGFTFEPTRPPTFGVSAPLWCGALTLPAIAGITPDVSARWLGLTFTALAVFVLVRAIARHIGLVEAVAVSLCLAADSRFTVWAMSGMEPPLGYMITALAFASLLSARCSPRRLGTLAASCAIHKLDMSGFALALIWAARAEGSGRVRSRLRAAAIAAVILAVFFGAAWIYYGDPLPLSVVRKFGRGHGEISPRWFTKEAFERGSGILLLAAATVGTLRALRTRNVALAAALVQLGSHAIAYSLRPPAERFGWYLAQAQPALCLLAGLGLAWIARTLAAAAPRAGAMAATAAAATFFAIAWHKDEAQRHSLEQWAGSVEPPRIAAGRWVAANTPADASLLTGFGLVAYYAQRTVHDYSGLTETVPPGVDLIAWANPDVIVFCEYDSAVSPDAYQPVAGFRIAQRFCDGWDPVRGWLPGQPRFYALVMVRNE